MIEAIKFEGLQHVVCQCDKCKAEKQEQGEPVAWINWCAATGKRCVSFECESELASQPLYFGVTQITQKRYSNQKLPTA
jgi:hypothetical protein